MIISNKDELYTFDELNYVFGFIENPFPADKVFVAQKIQILLQSLQGNKEGLAIFFMPKSTFDVFSMFGSNSVSCEIELEDVKKMIELISDCKNQEEEFNQHVLKKLLVLKEFLQQGNKVYPVASASDNVIK